MRITLNVATSKSSVLWVVLFVVASVGVVLGRTAQTGGEWSRQDSGTTQTLHGTWGTSPTDVFAVGEGGTILRYDGRSSRSLVSGTFETLFAVWGTSAMDVYAVGSRGTIVHYDGASWRLAAVDVGTQQNLLAVWGTSSSDVFAVGEGGSITHYDGNRWRAQNSGTNLRLSAVWGLSPTDVYVTGLGGTFVHYDGTAWQAQRLASAAQYDLQAIWGSSAADLHVAGAETIYRSSGRPGESYAYSGGTILHYDGTSWQPQAQEINSRLPFQAVWANSATDVYALANDTTLLHFDGTAWNAVAAHPPAHLAAIWGTPEGDVFAVGSLGTILRRSP